MFVALRSPRSCPSEYPIPRKHFTTNICSNRWLVETAYKLLEEKSKQVLQCSKGNPNCTYPLFRDYHWPHWQLLHIYNLVSIRFTSSHVSTDTALLPRVPYHDQWLALAPWCRSRLLNLPWQGHCTRSDRQGRWVREIPGAIAVSTLTTVG